MNISIDSAATFYPESLISADELAKMAGISTEEVLKKGVNSIHAAEKGTLTTDMAVKAVNEAIGDIDPKSIDQLAFISEGVSDYLYMDPSKNILKKIGGRIEDLIYSSDYFRGNDGAHRYVRPSADNEGRRCAKGIPAGTDERSGYHPLYDLRRRHHGKANVERAHPGICLHPRPAGTDRRLLHRGRDPGCQRGLWPQGHRQSERGGCAGGHRRGIHLHPGQL